MLPYSLNALASSSQPESAVLCRFPHGPPSALTDPSTFSSLDFQLHQSTESRDPRKSSHRVLTCDTANVEWTAANYGDSSYKLQPYTYAVGVVSDGERRIDLLPVQHVYNMRQHLKPHHQRPVVREEKDGSAKAAEGLSAGESYSMRQKALIDSFGSKKRKSQLASKESNKVVVQRDIANALDTALATNQPDVGEEGEGGEETDEALMRKTKKDILPPFDEYTDDPLLIYKLHDLIPSSLYSLMQPEAKRLLALAKNEATITALIQSIAAPATAVKEEEGKANTKVSAVDQQVSRFALQRLQLLTVTHASDPAAALRLCTLLAFYHLLLTMKLSNPRFPRRTLTQLPHPPPPDVQQYLLSTFTSGAPSHTVDGAGSRRLLCWLLVTSLLVAGGRLGGRELALVGEDVKLGGTELVGVYREVGCGKASKAEVQLTAPLAMGRFKRRKRKSAR